MTFPTSRIDKPAAPGTPTITEVTNDTATLEWTPPTKDGGSPVFNYVIEYKPISGKKWLPANKHETVLETTYTVLNLVEGDVYEFKISAENLAGVGKPSSVSEKVTIKVPVGELLKCFCFTQSNASMCYECVLVFLNAE